VIRFGLGEVVIHPGATGWSGPEVVIWQVHKDAFRDASLAVWPSGEDVFASRDWSAPRSAHIGMSGTSSPGRGMIVGQVSRSARCRTPTGGGMMHP
jgi:hypothetical protein